MTIALEARNIALFIDFENFGDHEEFDVKLVVEKMKERGRLTLKRAYADWGRFAKNKRQMLENSIELIELPSHGGNKNSADIKLVVDALDTAITKPYIDTIVVVSGDSDYTPLISKLREYNKYVIVIGSKKKVSSLLVGYCDELIYYSSLSGIDNPQEFNVSQAFDLLMRAVDFLADRGIETRSSIVKNYMKQLDASFDESNYGFSQFKTFLQQASQAGWVTLQSISGGQYLVTIPKKQAPDDTYAAEELKDLQSKKDEFARLLATIRKFKAQYLGYNIQRSVLQAIHRGFAAHNYIVSRQDLLESIMKEDLKHSVEANGLSKSKISGVLKILQWAGCFNTIINDDGITACWELKPEFRDAATLIRTHNIRMLYVALQNGIRISSAEWAKELLGSASQEALLRQLLNEAKGIKDTSFYDDTMDV